jgi:hypothetical protein
LLDPRLEGRRGNATIVGMDRRDEMRRWLARRERRGLTFRELSEEVGVPVGTLASWAWKLRQDEGCATTRAGRGPAFVELIAPRLMGARIEIALARDRRVIIDGEFDEGVLARVVRTLEQC